MTDRPKNLAVPGFPDGELEMLQRVLEASSGATLVLLPDENFTIVTANAAYLQATRTRNDDIAGRPLFEVFPDDPTEPGAEGATNLRARLRRVIETRQPETMPVQRYPIPDPDGGPGAFIERFWAARSSPVLDADGILRFIFHTVEDVTAATLRARELEEATAMLRINGEVARIGGWRVDIPGRKVTWSPEAATFHGRPGVSSLALDELLALYPAADADRLAKAIAAAAATARSFDEVVHFPLGGNRNGQLRVVGIAVRDDSGKVESFRGVIQDVTASSAQAEALVQSENRLRFIADSLPHIVWMSDAAGYVNFANDAFYEYVGAEKSVPAGDFWLDAVHPDDRERCIQKWLECVSEAKNYDLDFRVRRHDGEYRWQKINAVPVRDEHGVISGWYGAGVDVHEMVEARSQASRLADGLSSMLESISDGFINMDREWTITYANTQLGTLVGRDARELIGKNMWREFPEFEGTPVQDIYQRTMFEGVGGALTLYFPPGLSWLEVRAFPSEEGATIYVRDVTLERESAKNILESEERFRAIARATADALWDWDILEDHAWWSDGIETLFGHSASDFTGPGNRWMENVHPDDKLSIATTIWNAVNGSATEWSHEYRFKKSNGEYVRVADRASIIRNEQGVAIRMLGGITDISERYAAQRTIREQAELLNQARDAILVRDLSGTITYWNKGAEMLYGWLANEAIGKVGKELIYRDSTKFDQAHTALMANGAWTGELQHVTKAGDEVVVQTRWSLLVGEDGEPSAILSINTDITERKKLEQQFLRAQRMEAIGTLAGGIAHDLNNVLTPIMMSVALLEMDEEDPGRQQTLANVLQSAKKGADMIRQVLSFARGVDGQRIPVNMTQLIADVASVARDTFLKTVVVQVETPEGLWAVEGDPTQLHQVLINLCVNARDAMQTVGTLSIRAENVHLDDYFAGMQQEASSGPYVVLEVEDNGAGMDARTIERIFDPFFTTKEIGKGTGLGLSTSLAIVKSHSGFIRVYSEPGKGSKFRVYLPATEDVATSEEAAGRPSVLLPRGNGEGILVIDDEIAVLEITRQTLEAFGYRVTVASDGASAIATYAVERANIRAVITDMMMPVMDGLATITVLRRMNPDLPIIAASGLGTNAMDARATQAGVRQFLSKPYTAETLLVTLRRMLDEAAPAR